MKTPLRKITLIILGLITMSNVVAGDKEYLVKKCKDRESAESCENCEVKGKKISFKISKSFDSVMRTVTDLNGKSDSDVLDHCKVFDDETFECKKTTGEDSNDEFGYTEKSEKIYRLANGKFIYIGHSGESMRYPTRFPDGTTIKGFHFKASDDYWCATEIK